jgi:hypothetical protein
VVSGWLAAFESGPARGRMIGFREADGDACATVRGQWYLWGELSGALRAVQPCTLSAHDTYADRLRVICVCGEM